MIAFFLRLTCGVIFMSLCSPATIAANQAIVAKRTIYPGQKIEVANLKAVILIREPKIRYRYVENIDEIVGLVAKRTILQGRFIATTSAEPAATVRPGEKIRVQFQSGGLAIELVGIAMSEGHLGEEINLRNPESGKIFLGRIREDGVAVVGQP